MNIDELAEYFHKKGISSFFRWNKGHEVPIDSDRIIRAYHALSSGMSLQDVKNILYK